MYLGFLITYIGPLSFVLAITLIKEGYDDFKRYRRDKEMNQAVYQRLNISGELENMASSSLKVGDIIRIKAGERIPADLILLHTTEKSAACFIKTDQLDGETDWKLRKAVNWTQNLVHQGENLKDSGAWIRAESPHKDIYHFTGVLLTKNRHKEGLSLENTLWADTVITNGMAYALVLYTGKETRSQMNARSPRTKRGKVESEVNKLSIALFCLIFVLSLIIICMNGFHYRWYVIFFRYILLLSSIIPISMRVNLDLAKIWYSFSLYHDKQIPGTIARNSTIPEELGRIQYLFSDKTGTLTQNSMVFKRLYIDQKYYDSVNI